MSYLELFDYMFSITLPMEFWIAQGRIINSYHENKIDFDEYECLRAYWCERFNSMMRVG